MVLVSAGCGGSNEPTPSPSPTVKPGGTLSGRYQLELKLSPACGSNAVTASFPMVMAAAGTSPHPGIQVTLDGPEPGLLELELKYTGYVLEGGFGTTGDGVTSSQGPQTWVNAVGTGPVTQTPDGKGEVVAGSFRGYLEIEGTNPCTATDHAFTLRPR